MDLMEKKRIKGSRKENKTKNRRNKQLELEESASELEIQQLNRSPQGQNIPTQNQFDDEASQMADI